jgi:putative ABC transport system permease protein
LRQLAVESVLVALMGGVCAFFTAVWTVRGIRAILPPEIPRMQDIGIDSEVAWFTLGASLLAALLSGFVPALLSSRQDVSVAIKDSGAASGSGRGHNFLRQMLVIVEVALAIVLLIGATLAIQNFARIVRIDPGFRPDHLITMRIDFPKFRFVKVEQSTQFVEQVLESSRRIPLVAGRDFNSADRRENSPVFIVE